MISAFGVQFMDSLRKLHKEHGAKRDLLIADLTSIKEKKEEQESHIWGILGKPQEIQASENPEKQEESLKYGHELEEMSHEYLGSLNSDSKGTSSMNGHNKQVVADNTNEFEESLRNYEGGSALNSIKNRPPWTMESGSISSADHVSRELPADEKLASMKDAVQQVGTFPSGPPKCTCSNESSYGHFKSVTDSVMSSERILVRRPSKSIGTKPIKGVAIGRLKLRPKSKKSDSSSGINSLPEQSSKELVSMSAAETEVNLGQPTTHRRQNSLTYTNRRVSNPQVTLSASESLASAVGAATGHASRPLKKN